MTPILFVNYRQTNYNIIFFFKRLQNENLEVNTSYCQSIVITL